MRVMEGFAAEAFEAFSDYDTPRMSLLLLVFELGLSIAFVLFWVKKSLQKRPPLPPGPPGDPFIGHIRKIPAENQDIALYELGKTYGDIIYLEVLGRPIIVLNSVKAAMDLLDKRSANYSDRPRLHILELMGWRESLTLTPYGKTLRKYRGMFQDHLKLTKTIPYQPAQAQDAHVLLQNLLSDECRREFWLRWFSTSIIMRVAYGHQITSDDDSYLDLAEKVNQALGNSGSIGNTPIDFVPFLKYFPSWFPGAYYAGFARRQRVVVERLYDIPFDNVKAELASGTAKPSIVAQMLESLDPDERSGDNADILDIKGTAATMYAAGADTTWGTLSVFFLAMALYPEFQRRAQQEIDSVIGSERLPEFSDRESLPYVECIVRETMRWNPVVPTGVPHRSLADDIYRGMLIPKGSLMIPNTRAMAYDETVYTDPQAFKPSRYLPLPEGNCEPYLDASFGFGRRICPGRHLAASSVWIAIASILSTFDIFKPIGADGKEIIPKVKFSTGITSHPSSFDCRIRPRNDQARNLIVHGDTSGSD